jgi:tetratricopeptide (TPR) repeat protein
VRAIVGRADGVPLYAVETVRMLLADGRLTAQPDGTYEPAGDLSSIAVPESLNALIAARLDGLDGADRALLQEAAVLGQSFTLSSLAAVSGTEEATLQPRLKALVRRELLSLEGDVASPERGQYAFVQALIREVAYNTVAKRERKNRHLAAARYFESLGTDELAGALAGQYLAAYRNSPDGAEADAVAGQARIALTAAADRAVALGSNEQALAFFEQAMSVTTDPTETADLLARAGDTASKAGHHDQADRLLREALDRRRQLEDRPGTIRATTALGWALMNAWRTPDAIAVLAPAAEEFADLAADPVGVGLGAQLARAYFLSGELRRSIEAAEPVLEGAEIVADTLVTKGTALCALGRVTEGLAVLAAGRSLAETRNFGVTLLRANINLSEIEANRDPRAALEVARGWLPVAQRLGIREVAALGNGAEAAVRTGDWDWASDAIEQTLGEALEPAERLNLFPQLIAIRAFRGEDVAGLLAELEAARSSFGPSIDPTLIASLDLANAAAAFAEGRLSEARSTWRSSGQLLLTNLPRVLLPAARSALWAGDIAGARQDLGDLGSGGMHGPAIEASQATIRAGLEALEGRPGEALTLYREALQAWKELGLAWDEALTGLDMAILLDPADPEVATAADTAREILVRLEAAPFIKKLDEALATPVREAATEPAQAEGVAT